MDNSTTIKPTLDNSTINQKSFNITAIQANIDKAIKQCQEARDDGDPDIKIMVGDGENQVRFKFVSEVIRFFIEKGFLVE